MSDAKFTPGPWTCDVLTREVVVDAPCGRVLYCVSVECDENAVADGHLIAAAPDLLEALRGAISTIRAWHGEIAWEIYAANAPEMKRINAAIAKATGVQP